MSVSWCGCQCGFAESTLQLCKIKYTHRDLCDNLFFKIFVVMTHLLKLRKCKCNQNVMWFFWISANGERFCSLGSSLQSLTYRILRFSFVFYSTKFENKTVLFWQQNFFRHNKTDGNRFFFEVKFLCRFFLYCLLVLFICWWNLNPNRKFDFSKLTCLSIVKFWPIISCILN